MSCAGETLKNQRIKKSKAGVKEGGNLHGGNHLRQATLAGQTAKRREDRGINASIYRPARRSDASFCMAFFRFVVSVAICNLEAATSEAMFVRPVTWIVFN